DVNEIALSAADKADVVNRGFERKVQPFVKLLRDAEQFGQATTVLKTSNRICLFR
ncbi:hypothetical protein Tco_1469767, partial [Tanacetum coccineum]